MDQNQAGKGREFRKRMTVATTGTVTSHISAILWLSRTVHLGYTKVVAAGKQCAKACTYIKVARPVFQDFWKTPVK